MTLKIGEPAAPSFAQPLALLSDCHRRVERFLHVLEVVAGSPGDRDLTGPEREGLATALRYFREAAPRHTADEEESLFPRMRRVAPPPAVAALDRLAALEAEHDVAGPRHERIETLGQRWLAHGALEPAARTQFHGDVAALVGLYAGHIALEDGEIFPLAARILSPAEIRAVGLEMARRRGLDPVPFGLLPPFALTSPRS